MRLFKDIDVVHRPSSAARPITGEATMDKTTDEDNAAAGPLQRPVRPASEANGFYNPWRASLENCMTGDNFLRAQEWHDLIEELDDLFRYRCGQHSALQDAYAQGREDEREEATERMRAVCRYISDTLAEGTPNERTVARTIMHMLPLDGTKA